MDQTELTLRRLHNQFLVAAGSADEVVCGLIGLQAQHGAAALHALAIRSRGEIDYTAFVKTWSFRGTLHLHRKADLPLALYHGSETDYGQIALSKEYAASVRSGYFREIVLGLLDRGDCTREQLKEAFNSSGMTEQESPVILHSKGGLLRAMAEHGEIAYVADRNLIFTKLESMERMEQQPALAELVRRYISHYGPVSMCDAQTFFGLPQKLLKTHLEAAPERFSHQGQTYFAAGSVVPNGVTMPKVLFLAAFDQMLLGYQKTQNPILPQEHLKTIYSDNGIIMPTVLVDGKVRAVWRREHDTIELYPIFTLAARERSEICRAAEELFSNAALRWIEA